ncbi:EamA family transporter [Pedococcus sp. 5OH_020]|uniref:EamA family transporter n=1 Tax=Pedococcus sp. 5OH_020 TaxID=2989814 RepID=UPI0022E9C12D|nr:EamA family transporter [Pedococcus sp. 5OH_020]
MAATRGWTAPRFPARRSSASPLLLVVAAVVSVQFGGALAATLVPRIGAAGSVTLRLLFATAILWAYARPSLRGHTRRAWLTVVAFGVTLGLMNLCFYASLGHLPIGVAVTVEFLGPLTLATVLARRSRDLVAVLGAGVGVLLISRAFEVPVEDVEWSGLVLAALAGACWAGYILASGRAGREFPKLDGLALAMAVALVVTLPLGVRAVPQWTGEAVLKGLGIAVLSSVLPYSLELAALRRLSARVFGILLSLEPAVAALAGFLVLGQRLSGTQLGGMGLVVLASALVMGAGQQADPAASGG